ncbi:hypothetical protein SDC9_207572 [bioreactor metagenome]|uniref:Uncharacterized protein n=1 Tax=bioreactor metagenome TaxID=1076179 RepID=A0A645J9N1_9ZZZZ
MGLAAATHSHRSRCQIGAGRRRIGAEVVGSPCHHGIGGDIGGSHRAAAPHLVGMPGDLVSGERNGFRAPRHADGIAGVKPQRGATAQIGQRKVRGAVAAILNAQ